MSTPIEEIVAEIHASPIRVVLAMSGGGSGAISHLLVVPGASRTVLEAVVPYSPAAMTDWLGGTPDRFCSPSTARAMAMAAFDRARELSLGECPVAGVACTAALASDRAKRGEHRAHLALQTADSTATQTLTLEKGRRTRAEEEHLVELAMLNCMAEACSVARRLPLDLSDGVERFEATATTAPDAWRDLLLGRVDIVCHGRPAAQPPQTARAVFPGAFNPMHAGHRRMAEVAGRMLGLPVEFELSIKNADKPPLDYFEIARRTGQFAQDETLWLTRSPTFEEKSRLLPRSTFIVGTDTLSRIAEPRFYGNNPEACRAAIEAIAARGCGFLVFGRDGPDGFATLSHLDVADPLASICREVPGDQFRENVCSRAIRASGKW